MLGIWCIVFIISIGSVVFSGPCSHLLIEVFSVHSVRVRVVTTGNVLWHGLLTQYNYFRVRQVPQIHLSLDGVIKIRITSGSGTERGRNSIRTGWGAGADHG